MMDVVSVSYDRLLSKMLGIIEGVELHYEAKAKRELSNVYIIEISKTSMRLCVRYDMFYFIWKPYYSPTSFNHQPHVFTRTETFIKHVLQSTA